MIFNSLCCEKAYAFEERRQFLTLVKDLLCARHFPDMNSLNLVRFLVFLNLHFIYKIIKIQKKLSGLSRSQMLNRSKSYLKATGAGRHNRVWSDLKITAIFFFFLRTDHLPVDFSCYVFKFHLVLFIHSARTLTRGLLCPLRAPWRNNHQARNTPKTTLLLLMVTK